MGSNATELVAEARRLKSILEAAQAVTERMLIALLIAEAEGDTERGLSAIGRALDYTQELARITGDL